VTINSISNPNAFKMLDEITNQTFFGCSQEWYATDWQRLSGCGPTAASNIIYYLRHSQTVIGQEKSVCSKKNSISLMEEIWEFVTPTAEGIKTTQMFYEAVHTYAKLKGLNVEFEFCDLPDDKAMRPELSSILSFLDKALTNDAPVAFLNLCNGEEENLEQWHWVTIISLEYTDDRESAFVNILDEGQIKKIDLALWYKTTTLGGGFVYFSDAK